MRESIKHFQGGVWRIILFTKVGGCLKPISGISPSNSFNLSFPEDGRKSPDTHLFLDTHMKGYDVGPKQPTILNMCFYTYFTIQVEENVLFKIPTNDFINNFVNEIICLALTF